MNDAPAAPIRPTDDAARALAAGLLADARHAALGVLLPGSGAPFVTRVGFAASPGAAPLALISDLAPHTAALRADPRCSLLIGEPGPKGDPLTHPRLTLEAAARFIAPDGEARATARAHYLEAQPKARLYIDFADFHLVAFSVSAGSLNGGFGKAYLLGPEDMGLASPG